MNKENIYYLLYASSGISTLSLVFGFSLSQYPSISFIVAVIGIIWTLVYRQGQPRLKNAGFIIMIVMTISAALLGVNQYLLLVNIIFALIAWDISYFTALLKLTDNLSKETDIINTHILRLAIICILGFFLGVIALLLEFDFSFGWALILGLLLIISLSKTIRFVRHI